MRTRRAVDSGRLESRLDEDTGFTADKRTGFVGRKDLTVKDLSVGSPVKLTFVAESGKLLEVRVRYEKPQPAVRKR